ncbi:hypothetical protein B7P33_06310 [Sediminicola luteus]|uniref:Uncharacterized protein n=1 Tax=Sediminicola luteus TaxID=319238 RepID=A0A2A4G9Y1_9FLAO|nr:hypothetical protein B7P33_06310 [Sediminicola luteus]
MECNFSGLLSWQSIYQPIHSVAVGFLVFVAMIIFIVSNKNNKKLNKVMYGVNQVTPKIMIETAIIHHLKRILKVSKMLKFL